MKIKNVSNKSKGSDKDEIIMNSNVKNLTENDNLKTIGFSSNRKLDRKKILKLQKENKIKK